MSVFLIVAKFEWKVTRRCRTQQELCIFKNCFWCRWRISKDMVNIHAYRFRSNDWNSIISRWLLKLGEKLWHHTWNQNVLYIRINNVCETNIQILERSWIRTEICLVLLEGTRLMSKSTKNLNWAENERS